LGGVLTGEVLDKRNVTAFDNGRYLTWKIQGRNAVISGIFFDAVK